METRRLGSSDLDLTVIGLGCWLMGRSEWHEVDDNESARAIHAALDAGINWLDTAEVYGSGHSEELIGRVLAERGREGVLVATKVWAGNLSREGVPAALERSLQRLRTDYVDLYQIHRPNADIPIGETMEALLRLQQQGKLRHIGVSNLSVEQMQEALQYGPIVSSQPAYSLFFRYVEKRETPFCLEHSIGIIPYSPLAQGLLTGKFARDWRPPGDDNRRFNRLFQEPTYGVALDQVEVVRQIGEKYGKTPAQVALRWLIQQPGVTSVIAGARNERQVADNVGAAGWELAPEDAAALSAAGDKVMATLPEGGEEVSMWDWG
jgi:aryl-alcohol dehydrogenase-like predicted oxidoreductase